MEGVHAPLASAALGTPETRGREEAYERRARVYAMGDNV